jgi:hypothetical protein
MPLTLLYNVDTTEVFLLVVVLVIVIEYFRGRGGGGERVGYQSGFESDFGDSTPAD